MSSGLSFRIESTQINGETLWSFAMYAPSGAIAVFSPYYKNWSDLESNAKAFLFNFNHPEIFLTDIDGQLKPDLGSESMVEKYYAELYLRCIGEPQKLISPPEPRKRHLRLVTDCST